MSIALIQQRGLHCGGTQAIEDDQQRKSLTYFVIWQTIFLFFAVVALLTEHSLIFTSVAFLVAFAYLGEIGWGNPFHFLFLFISVLK